jgi:DNA-binding transcriptional MerR regulator
VTQPEGLWTVRQTAAEFGVKPTTIRNWIKIGTMVPRPVRGPRYYFNPEQVRLAVTAKLARPLQPQTRHYFRGTSHLRRTA